jgi:hypothetical protein
MMTLAQIEERLTALEKAVKELQTQRMAPSLEGMNSDESSLPENDDELLPGVEYPFIVTVPPKEEWHIVGKIVAIETPPAELGLSDAEWASLDLGEDEDE